LAENKTKPTEVSVAEFIAAVPNPRRRFGKERYTTDAGRSGEVPRIGFAPRGSSLVLYVSKSFDGADALLARMGKLKTSKACIYVNKLADVDMELLREFVERGFAHSFVTNPA
jgi:hypothetical protein